MIEKDTFDDFIIACNNCWEEERFETNGDFSAAIKEAKEYGWTIKKVRDNWEHYCPDCSK